MNLKPRPVTPPAPPPNTAYQHSRIPPPLGSVDPPKGPWQMIDPRRCATAEGTYPMREMLAASAAPSPPGQSVALLAPKLESGIFYMRPDADDSCHQLEVGKYLRGNSPLGGVGGGIGGLGPNITPPPAPGGPGAGTPPPAPDIGSAVNRYNQMEAEVEDLALRQRLQALIDGYHQTGKMDPNELSLIEQSQEALRQQKIAAQNSADDQGLLRNQDYRAQQRAQADAQPDSQAQLRNKYDELLKQASGPDGSAAAMGLVDPWHDLVVRPDGAIDPEALRQMQLDMMRATQGTNSAQAALANATSDSADNALAAVRGVRNASIFAVSSVLSGGMAAAGYSPMVVGGAMGAATGGFTSFADGQGFVAGALAGGLKGTAFGAFAPFLGAIPGLNPYLGGAAVGSALGVCRAGMMVPAPPRALSGEAPSGVAGTWLGGQGANWAANNGWAAPPAPFEPTVPEAAPPVMGPKGRSRLTVRRAAS